MTCLTVGSASAARIAWLRLIGSVVAVGIVVLTVVFAGPFGLMNSVTTSFDTERLIERRIRVGHSVLSLAGHLGVSAATVRALEGGASPTDYELGILTRYAQALGLEFDELFAGPPAPSADTGSVIALLHSTGGTAHLDALGEALGWTPERTVAALRAADGPAATVGLRIAWFGDVAVTLVPELAATDAVVTYSARAIQSAGLNRDAARVVATLAARSTLAYSESPSLRQLLDAGIVEFAPATKKATPRGGVRRTLRLTEQARYDLCL